METLTLQDLTDEALALDELVAMDDGEWTETHEILAQELTEKMLGKSDRFADYILDKRSRCEALKAEERRLADRRKRFESAISRLESYARACMQRLGRDKLEGTRHTISLKKNPPAVYVEQPEILLHDEAAEAAGYVRVVTERTLDRKRLYEALKLGAEIPGCRLTQGVRVEIK